MFYQIVIVLAAFVLYELLKIAIALMQKKRRIAKLSRLSDDELIAYIDNFVEKERTRQHIAGMSVGIVKNGKTILSKGYGFADIDESKPATDETVYEIASVSKHMVAICIMVLAEQGKLSLTDHLHKYLPDAPAAWDGITIRELLNLTSGLRRESPAFNRTEQQPLGRLIRAIYDYPLAFAPGTRWQYNNMSYFILADIIEKVTGESFEDHTNNFFADIGLKETTTTTKSNSTEKAAGYLFSRRSRSFRKMASSALRPSGAFASSISDMLLWDSLLFESNILTQQHWPQTYSDVIKIGPFTTNYGSPVGGATVSGSNMISRFNQRPELYYGYGWGTTIYKDRRLLTHGGGNLGFTADYWKFIDDKTSIIILANTYGRNLATISERIYEAIENVK